MDRFIPLNKQTKKRQKVYHSAQRGTWGAVQPVTRIVRSRKAYDRSKTRRDCRRETMEG